MRWSSLALAALGALFVLGAAFVADQAYFAHGYSAHWYQFVEQERVLIDSTTEHRVRFPNAHRPLARYVQGWPMDRLGVPRELPRIDAVLRARIDIPGQLPLRLGVRANETARIWADGEPLGDRRLAPGPHDLWIHWRAKPRPHGRTHAHDTAWFQLTWGAAEEPDAPVPASALSPADGWDSGRTTLWVIAAILALLLALGLFAFDSASDGLIRRRRAGVVLAGAIVVLGLGFRGFDYDVMPEFRDNADELFATWNGWSLLEDGTTRGWSIWISAYRGRSRITPVAFFGEDAYVVTPYFEHPPLMHVLVGAAAHAGGADHYLEAKLKHTRLVPIALMAIGTLLMIAVGRRLFPDSWAPWVGALLFNVLPSITLQTRVIKEEDVLVPLLLGAVLFFLRWRDDGQRTRDWVGAAICVGLAPLAKVPAGAFIVGMVMLFAAQRRGLTTGVKVMIVGFAIGSTLLLYGLLIDWDDFLYATRLQSGRAINWNIFPRFFDVGKINANRIGRGWTLFLWITFAASVHARGVRHSAVLTVPTLVYLVAIAVGSGNWTYGWYVVPLYPFLCLGAGDYIVRTWHKPTLIGGLLLVGLLCFYTLNFTLDPERIRDATTWPHLRAMITAATVVGLAPFALAEVWREHPWVRRFARLAILASLVVTCVFSAWMVTRYDTIYESHHEMDVDDWFAR